MNPADDFFENAMLAVQQLTAVPTHSPATVPSNSDELFYFYIRSEVKKLNSEAQDYVKQMCYNSISEAKIRFRNQ